MLHRNYYPWAIHVRGKPTTSQREEALRGSSRRLRLQDLSGMRGRAQRSDQRRINLRLIRTVGLRAMRLDVVGIRLVR